VPLGTGLPITGVVVQDLLWGRTGGRAGPGLGVQWPVLVTFSCFALWLVLLSLLLRWSCPRHRPAWAPWSYGGLRYMHWGAHTQRHCEQTSGIVGVGGFLTAVRKKWCLLRARQVNVCSSAAKTVKPYLYLIPVKILYIFWTTMSSWFSLTLFWFLQSLKCFCLISYLSFFGSRPSFLNNDISIKRPFLEHLVKSNLSWSSRLAKIHAFRLSNLSVVVSISDGPYVYIMTLKTKHKPSLPVTTRC